MVLLGCQCLERFLFGNLNVDAHAVGIAASLLQQFLRGTRDGLQVDVAVEAVNGAKVAHNSCQAFHRIVRIAHYPTRQEQSFDVVATIELHGDFLEFGDGERGTLDVVGATVNAVGTVVHAVISEHDL